MVWTPDGSTLLVLNARSRNVDFLDGVTMATIGVAPVGAGALELEITPGGQLALVPSSIEGTLHVLDVPTRSSAAVIALSSPGPYGVEVASDSSFAVVMGYGDATTVSSVSVVDLLTRQETLRFRAPGQSPHPDSWSGTRQDAGVELAPSVSAMVTSTDNG